MFRVPTLLELWLRSEIIYTDDSAYPTEKYKLRRMDQLVTTTDFTPPQPKPYQQPPASQTSSKTSTPSNIRYVVDLCKPEDHDCTTMQHWTPIECRLWLSKIVHDSHALNFADSHAEIGAFRENGSRLQEMTVEEIREVLPKHYRLVCGQRQVLWNRCRACMVDTMNKKKLVRLNAVETQKTVNGKKNEK